VIAKRAGELVDRFNGFVSEIDNIAKALEAAIDSCEGARRKLSTGRGNLVGRAQQLQTLGACSGKNTGGKNSVAKNRAAATLAGKKSADKTTGENLVSCKTLLQE